MFEKTHVRLTHKVIRTQYGGAQTGSISEVLEDYAGDLVAIKPGHEPTQLDCACGNAYMFQVLTQNEYQQKLRQKFRHRLIVLLVSSFFVGIGALLAFNVDFLALQIIGYVLFVPSQIICAVTLLRMLFAWPKEYSLEQKDSSFIPTGRWGATHGVKFS